MKKQQDIVINKKPLKVYLLYEDGETYLGIWEYDKDNNIYVGTKGHISYDKMLLVAMGKLDYIRIELGE